MDATIHPNILERHMHDETYLAVEQSPEKPGIRRLGKAANSNNGAGLNGDAAFEFAFHGPAGSFEEHEKHQVMRFALEEVYREISNKDPKDLENADLKNLIASHYRDSKNDPTGKMVLTIVTIDPDRRSDSFADALGKIETFTEQSKKLLVADAYSQLDELTRNPREIDEARAGEIQRLSDAIVHIRQRGAFSVGQLDDAQKKRLGTLVNENPRIRDATAAADQRHSTATGPLMLRKDVHDAFEKGAKRREAEKVSPGALPTPGSVKLLRREDRTEDLPETKPAPAKLVKPNPRKEATAAREALGSAMRGAAAGIAGWAV